MADKGAALKQKLINKALAASTAAAVQLRTELREETPKDTGRTSRQWYVTPPTLVGKSIQFSIRHPFTGETPEKSPRVEWLSDGTKAHPISSKSGKVLVFPGRHQAFNPATRRGGVFPTRTGGALVFVPPKAQPVNHPGTTGSGFINRILSKQHVGGVFRRAFATTT